MYGSTNRILTTGNAYLAVTNLAGSATTQALDGLPLGTATGTATGELALKVMSIGGTGTTTVPGFAIPAYDYAGMTYVGSTNNVSTIVYKTGGSGGTAVATLTFTYVSAGAANDDNIASITKT